jgi:D-threonate/D-erythronate kinase
MELPRMLEHDAKFALVIADDLTGACDAAVHFAARGKRTRLFLDRQCADADVIAVSTESRESDDAEIISRMQDLARAWSPRPEVIFKKIDSVLRGRPGVEVAATLDAFECDVAVITPAFPALGRKVKGGILQVDGLCSLTDVAAKLRDDGLSGCIHGSVEEAVRQGRRYISVDAETGSDLRHVVAAALALGKRVLWAGSGGLAAALASVLCGNELTPHPPAKVAGPTIFFIGSTHPATLVQQEQFVRSRATAVICADTSERSALASALADGRHVIVRIVRGVTPAERIRALLQGACPAALFCCGGDTASLVCAAVGASGIELRGEIAAGVPWGVISGGMMEGVHAVTKSGGFGGPDTLIRTADWFTCPNPNY